MNKSIVFQFFHSLQFSKLRERFFQKLFSDCCGQLPYKEHLHLWRQTGCCYPVEQSIFVGFSKGACWTCEPWPWPPGLAQRRGQPTPQWLGSPTPWPCHSWGGGEPVLQTCGPRTLENRSHDSSSCHRAGGTIWPLGDPLWKQTEHLQVPKQLSCLSPSSDDLFYYILTQILCSAFEIDL